MHCLQSRMQSRLNYETHQSPVLYSQTRIGRSRSDTRASTSGSHLTPYRRFTTRGERQRLAHIAFRTRRMVRLGNQRRIEQGILWRNRVQTNSKAAASLSHLLPLWLPSVPHSRTNFVLAFFAFSRKTPFFPPLTIFFQFNILASLWCGPGRLEYRNGMLADHSCQ